MEITDGTEDSVCEIEFDGSMILSQAEVINQDPSSHIQPATTDKSI